MCNHFNFYIIRMLTVLQPRFQKKRGTAASLGLRHGSKEEVTMIRAGFDGLLLDLLTG